MPQHHTLWSERTAHMWPAPMEMSIAVIGSVRCVGTALMTPSASPQQSTFPSARRAHVSASLAASSVIPTFDVTQAPLEQNWPAPQALPQAPQFMESLVTSWQEPLQMSCPGLQPADAQLPPMQTSPTGQAWPQAPQLAGSSRDATSQPLAAT